MRIHKEGWSTLIVVFILLIIVNGLIYSVIASQWILWLSAIVSAVLFILVLQFFRHPTRIIGDQNDSVVYAPADGKVVVIEDTIETEYFKDERLMISIFMSPLNVHCNRHPVGGTISYSKYHPGKYLVAWHPKSSTENERSTLVYKTSKAEVLTRQIAGALARRIKTYVSKGDAVQQGDEMGFIKFGSRVDVFLPVGTAYKVQMGQTVRANVDVLAELE